MFDPNRFWSQVCQQDGCWEWQGATNRGGYGKYNYGGKEYRSHVVAWSLANGRYLAPGMLVRHLCNNKLCCNPSHLREGTSSENAQDRIADGTQHVFPSGESHPNAQITDAERETIMKLARIVSPYEIVKLKKYRGRVTPATIYQWLKR